MSQHTDRPDELNELEPLTGSLGTRVDSMHVDADLFLRAYEEYARRVYAGYSESFTTFLLNYTRSETEIVVDIGDRDIQEFNREVQAVDIPEDRSIGTVTVKDDSRDL